MKQNNYPTDFDERECECEQTNIPFEPTDQDLQQTHSRWLMFVIGLSFLIAAFWGTWWELLVAPAWFYAVVKTHFYQLDIEQRNNDADKH